MHARGGGAEAVAAAAPPPLEREQRGAAHARGGTHLGILIVPSRLKLAGVSALPCCAGQPLNALVVTGIVAWNGPMPSKIGPFSSPAMENDDPW